MVRNKAFLFLGKKDIRLKLGPSMDEAAELAEKEPGEFKVGMGGWTTVTVNGVASAPPGLLERWIDESYRLLRRRNCWRRYRSVKPPNRIRQCCRSCRR